MSQSPARLRIRPLRWALITLLPLGVVLAGLPATSASAAATGLITGTVTFHETNADRTLEVFRETTGGAFVEDQSLDTVVASDGTYSVHAPAGVQVKLRVSYGEANYGYWYGDEFNQDTAVPVSAAAGQTVSDIDLQVPVPVRYSGKLVDRAGNPVSGTVTPTVNTEGASTPSVTEPIAVDSSGVFSVILPARDGGVYESGVMGADPSGNDWAWLGGGSGYEPNFYLNPAPGDSFTGQVINLPIGSAQSVAPAQHAAATHFKALKSPVVHGTTRKGAILRTTTGRYNQKPATVRIQWLRNGHAIRGATTATYRLKKADVRKRLSVRVTATHSGARVHAISARTPAVRAR
jgi:hypothetical protein